jgi:hypothetical protein
VLNLAGITTQITERREGKELKEKRKGAKIFSKWSASLRAPAFPLRLCEIDHLK